MVSSCRRRRKSRIRINNGGKEGRKVINIYKYFLYIKHSGVD
jgi:hypothetical protein